MSVENLFKIEIPDEVAGRIRTVGDLHEFVVAELTRLDRPDVNRDIVYDVLRNLICHHLGVARERVIPSARFVEDLDLS